MGSLLAAASIDHYIPITEKTHVINRRHVTRQIPILGEYILFAVSSGWHELFKFRGVAGVLMNNLGFPAQVLPRELERLRAEYGSDVYRPAQPIIGGFRQGDKVVPKEGPFAMHVGRYDGKTRKGDAAIFVLFGREQRVTFAKGTLTPA